MRSPEASRLLGQDAPAVFFLLFGKSPRNMFGFLDFFILSEILLQHVKTNWQFNAYICD